jgi:ectoine hydroxylase-related dioxygenase (phytanoyl-CoA dioxygenase family)
LHGGDHNLGVVDGPAETVGAGGPVEPELVEAFWRDGVVVVRGVIGPAWVAALERGMEANFAAPGPWACRYTPEGEPGGFRDDYCNWDRIPEYERFLFDSPAAALAGGILRSDRIRLFHEHVLDKAPGTREVTPWHHDQPYYCVDGDQVCTTWFPLDPVPAEAAVEFVAGSHLGPMLMPRTFVDQQPYPYEPGSLSPVPDIDADRGSHRILSWAMEPGDCLVFHMRTIHGAAGTTTLTRHRRAFAARWLGDDAVYARRPGPTSPPFPGLEGRLSPGDPMDDPLFPVVWSAGGTA